MIDAVKRYLGVSGTWLGRKRASPMTEVNLLEKRDLTFQDSLYTLLGTAKLF